MYVVYGPCAAGAFADKHGWFTVWAVASGEQSGFEGEADVYGFGVELES